MDESTLQHYGVLGQRWGIRRSRRFGGDGTAYEKTLARQQKKDDKWASKQGARLQKRSSKSISREMKTFLKKDFKPQYTSRSTLTAKSILEYNSKLASILNSKVNDEKLRSPSGKVLRFVAKRGEIGIYAAYADSGYDMKKIQNGVFESGKVGYRDENVKKGG